MSTVQEKAWGEQRGNLPEPEITKARVDARCACGAPISIVREVGPLHPTESERQALARRGPLRMSPKKCDACLALDTINHSPDGGYSRGVPVATIRATMARLAKGSAMDGLRAAALGEVLASARPWNIEGRISPHDLTTGQHSGLLAVVVTDLLLGANNEPDFKFDVGEIYICNLMVKDKIYSNVDIEGCLRRHATGDFGSFGNLAQAPEIAEDDRQWRPDRPPLVRNALAVADGCGAVYSRLPTEIEVHSPAYPGDATRRTVVRDVHIVTSLVPGASKTLIWGGVHSQRTGPF